MVWFGKLEIDKDVGTLILDTKNRGFKLRLREQNKSELTFTARDTDGTLVNDIKKDKRCRVFADTFVNPTTKRFEGIIEIRELEGSFNQVLNCEAFDFFRWAIMNRVLNKSYSNLKVGAIVRDWQNNGLPDKLNEFTFTSTEDTSVTVSSINFIYESYKGCLDRIAERSLGEYYCKPDLDVIFRHKRIKDSGITISQSMVKDVAKLMEEIADTVKEVIVIGGKDAGNNRIIVKAVSSSYPFAKRTLSIVDERYTTYEGAKLRATTEVKDKDFERKDLPVLEVQNLTTLPIPGELVTINLPKYGLSSVKFVVREIELNFRPGEDSVEWVKIKVGETEQSLQALLENEIAEFESDKRKQIPISELANQQLVNGTDALTFSEAKTITVKVGGTYVYDTAKYGFADYG